MRQILLCGLVLLTLAACRRHAFSDEQALGFAPTTQPSPGGTVAASALTGELPPSDQVALAHHLCRTAGTREQRTLGLKYAHAAYKALPEVNPAAIDKAVAPADRPVALAMARCAFYAADWETDEAKIEHIAGLALDAAEKAGAGKDGAAEANYYYGLSLGMRLRLGGIGAVLKLPSVESHLKLAAQSPDQDFGGPARVLGMLYLKAPAWPQGIGDLESSLEFLRRVAEAHPAHPQNHLFYAEALVEDGQYERAQSQLALVRAWADRVVWGDYADRWLADAAELEKTVAAHLKK